MSLPHFPEGTAETQRRDLPKEAGEGTLCPTLQLQAHRLFELLAVQCQLEVCPEVLSSPLLVYIIGNSTFLKAPLQAFWLIT